MEIVKSKIKECNELIAHFESKYGMKFEEFKIKWKTGKIKDRYSHEVESDYIEWEALEMEKRKIIYLFSRFF